MGLLRGVFRAKVTKKYHVRCSNEWALTLKSLIFKNVTVKISKKNKILIIVFNHRID